MRRRAFLATAGGATLGAAGCLGARGSSGGTGRNEHDIGMSVSRFRPDELAVAPGTTVVWRNTSKQGHTVTAYDGAIPGEASYFATGGFESEAAAREAWRDRSGGLLEQGDTFEHTFEVPGTYNYVCIPHEAGGMVGTVRVTGGATRTPR